MQTEAWQRFGRIFADIKSHWDKRRSLDSELICKQGLCMNSSVLKLQKASWTNDRMDRIQNESGVFFSIWVNEKTASKNRANYNIHALKLRHLKGYSIASRDFAQEFRSRFTRLQDQWPNVALDYGPLTLMEGWIAVNETSAERSILLMMKQFEQVSPLIDHLLESRRT